MATVQEGWKIVSATMASFHGTVTWTLGKEQRLPRREIPMLLCCGFHFCPEAIDCLAATGWQKGYRLLRVRVPDPDGALVLCSRNGRVCCSNALVAVEDVTDTGGLLQLRQRVPWGFNAFEVSGIDADGNLCSVLRLPGGHRRKKWGSDMDHVRKVLTQDEPDHGGPIRAIDWSESQLLEPGTSEWQAAATILDRVEPFECNDPAPS
jgi:hypothetical protein